MERPIVQRAHEVCALLAGTRTQMRLVIKEQPPSDTAIDECHWVRSGFALSTDGACSCQEVELPFTESDRLWVRETWAHYHTVNHIRRTHGGAFSEVSDGLAGYRADGHDTIGDFRDHVRLMSGCDLDAVEINGDRWLPSTNMPRWASRLTLTVTDVRVQRLWDISEDDAIAEGIDLDSDFANLCSNIEGASYPNDLPKGSATIAVFRKSWDGIHGAGAWGRNEWVAAYTFTVEHANIDAGRAALRREG